jgi:hypothetical protein
MAGQAGGGQTLTPNRDITARAGFGGDLWGANGGGIAPCNTKSINQTLSDGETAANYEQNPIPVGAAGAPTESVLSKVNNAALSLQTADSALAAGGSNQG